MPIDKKRLGEIVDAEISSRASAEKCVRFDDQDRRGFLSSLDRIMIGCIAIRVRNVLCYIRGSRKLSSSDQMLLDIERELEELLVHLQRWERESS